MSQIICDQYLHPGDRVKVEVYAEDGSLQHTSYYATEVNGSVVALVVEES